MLRVLPFVQQVRENRNRHDKGSLEEKFWKEIEIHYTENSLRVFTQRLHLIPPVG